MIQYNSNNINNQGSNAWSSNLDRPPTISCPPSSKSSNCSSATTCCKRCSWCVLSRIFVKPSLHQYCYITLQETNYRMIAGGYGKLIGAGGSPGMSSHRYSPYSLPMLMLMSWWWGGNEKTRDHWGITSLLSTNRQSSYNFTVDTEWPIVIQ